jgi:two-component system response regulator FimZ (fimbrial Z protein)
MKRIVIVDDPIIRGAIAGVLHADPELDLIGECGDGEHGLEMVLNERPDVVILDLDLPRLDGLSVIRRIRAQNACKVNFQSQANGKQSPASASRRRL